MCGPAARARFTVNVLTCPPPPPAGMVLVRTETGQLVMVPQQVLAQAQAKTQQSQAVTSITQRPATPTAATTIRVSTAPTVSSAHTMQVQEFFTSHLIFVSLSYSQSDELDQSQASSSVGVGFNNQ